VQRPRDASLFKYGKYAAGPVGTIVGLAAPAKSARQAALEQDEDGGCTTDRGDHLPLRVERRFQEAEEGVSCFCLARRVLSVAANGQHSFVRLSHHTGNTTSCRTHSWSNPQKAIDEMAAMRLTQTGRQADTTQQQHQGQASGQHPRMHKKQAGAATAAQTGRHRQPLGNSQPQATPQNPHNHSAGVVWCVHVHVRFTLAAGKQGAVPALTSAVLNGLTVL